MTIDKGKSIHNKDAKLMDPYLWLEEVSFESEQWVHDHNRITLDAFGLDPRFNEFKEIVKTETALPSSDITIQGDYVYELDSAKSVWRRTTQDSFHGGYPEWDYLLRYSPEAGRLAGIRCLAPQYERCLLMFSDDNSCYVVREYDTVEKAFVDSSFQLEEGRHMLRWVDHDTMYLLDDDEKTDYGGWRTIKEWHRNTPIESANILFEGNRADIAVMGLKMFESTGDLNIFLRKTGMNTTEHLIRHPDNNLIEVPVPNTAELKEAFDDHLIFLLHENWCPKWTGQRIPAGSVIAIDVLPLLSGIEEAPHVEVLFEESARTGFRDMAVTSDAVYVATLEDARNRLTRFARSDAGDIYGKSIWTEKDVKVPEIGMIDFESSSLYSDLVYINYQGFLTPRELLRYDPGVKEMKTIEKIEAAFDVKDLVVAQHMAVSDDGTQIPYFIVHRKDMTYDGSTPTLLTAYGGFMKSTLPGYSEILGKIWIERGGAFAIANPRGGNEMGMSWHSAALKENRQRSFDDFIAVAEDLINRKITSPRHLGIKGGSYGGLLVSVAFTQRPDLFNAVVSESAVLDMARYLKMGGKEYWRDEYGDPQVSEDRETMLAYSPYHNIRPDVGYPEVLFVSASNDDVVNPGHTRKMVARMEEMGYSVFSYENGSGSHSSHGPSSEKATHLALVYTYLAGKLFDENTSTTP